MRKLTHQELLARQNLSRNAPRLPLSLVLDNIRSIHNVGSIFRLADGAGVEQIWLCGITGYPPNNGIAKTALGAEDRVSWKHERDTYSVVRQLKSQGYQIVLLEQTDQSVAYESFSPKPPVCLVIGNEIEGVSDDLVEAADAAVEIGMSGIKNSLNAAVACGIVTYAFKQKLESTMIV